MTLSAIGVELRQVDGGELANNAFVWFALPRRAQALILQGIVDDYHRYYTCPSFFMAAAAIGTEPQQVDGGRTLSVKIRPICRPELANLAFVSPTLPHHSQALKLQGIVDNYIRKPL